MSNKKIGSLEWAQMTGGNLSKNERLRLIAQALLMRLTSMPARGMRKARMLRTDAARIDLDGIRIPDTRAARDAFELCAETSPAFLLNHCMRTYLWGALLAAGQRLPYDEELFYVAALLHDLGLAKNHHGNVHCSCFAAQGALAVRQFAKDRHWPEARQHALSDAICLHLNIRVTKHQGIEAHLLHEGASLDVTGSRFNRIHARDRDDVLSRHPRAGFKAEMAGLMKKEAQAAPASRAGFLVGLGLTRMIRAAPFAE